MKLYEINSLKQYDFSCIYLWTNLVNDKKYVGQAQSFYKRMSQYKDGHFNQYMQLAIDKYGLDNFDITILERDVPIEILDSREQYWLDYYQSYNHDYGYNICQFAGTTRGYKHTEESKELMSKIAVQRFEDPTERRRLQGENNGMYGKHHTDEWREQHSNWLKDRWANDKEYRQFWHDKMSGENNYFYGKDFSGAKNGRATAILCVELNKTYTTIKEAANDIGISRQNISHVLSGRQERAGGYHWKYA